MQTVSTGWRQFTGNVKTFSGKIKRTISKYLLIDSPRENYSYMEKMKTVNDMPNTNLPPTEFKPGNSSSVMESNNHSAIMKLQPKN